MLRRFIATLLLLPVLALSGLRAQTVGVVMSGGGAKGLYHIGVLEALEECGVPIDYVAGTSMGAIVAALYASGYSPAEMREIVLSGVVKEWVSGRIDPIYMPYYRQVGRLPSFLRLRMNLSASEGKPLRMPTSLLSSTPLDMAFVELFAPATAASGGDFDNLMIPFLCVASDMNARRGVVLRDGDLGLAVRSSMSLPMAYKPVKLDSMLLYDGGIFDNFPWRPLDERFRPELIVGSVCTKGNTPPSEDNSLMDQALVLSMQESDYSLPEGRSLMIRRAVPVSTLDFDSAGEVMRLGYEDAMERLPALLDSLVVRRDSAYYARRRAAFRAKCPPLLFGRYDIEGLDSTQLEYVHDFLGGERRHGRGERRMGFARLRDNLYGILAGGDFTMEYPQAVYLPDEGCYSFGAKLTTRPRFSVTIGGNLSSTAFNQAYVGVAYETIGRVAHSFATDLYLGPLYTWGTFGGRTDIHLGRPLFFDYAFNFAVRNLRHGTFGNVTKVDNALQVKNSEGFLSLGAGLPIRRRSLIALRADGGFVNYRYDADDLFADDTDHSRFSYFGLKLEGERNTLDKPLFPRKGSLLTLSGIYIIGRDRYRPWNAASFVSSRRRQWLGARVTWNRYFDLPGCDWFSMGINVDAVITNQPDFATRYATLMALPAYEPVVQSRMIFMPDFSGRRFLAGGVMPTFDLWPNLFLRAGAFVMWRDRRDFSPFDYGGTERHDDPVHYIVEGALVYHTSVGPVSLSLTKYDLRSWKNLYLMLNFGYALFAPRGTFY